MANGLHAPITDGQTQALMELLIEAGQKAIERIPLTRQGAQICLEKGGDLIKGIISAISQRMHSGRFTLVGGLKFRVPEFYDHRSQLSTFRHSRFVTASEKHGCQYQRSQMDDEAFSWTQDELRPGKLYYASFVEIVGASMNDCLDFLANQNALFVGAQGLSLILQLRHNEFPAGKRVLSFGKRDPAVDDRNDDRLVAYASVHWIDHNFWSFGAASTAKEFSGNHEWPGGYCILSVTEAD